MTVSVLAPDGAVEVDEALIGRRKGHRGRMVDRHWVLGMIAENVDLRPLLKP